MSILLSVCDSNGENTYQSTKIIPTDNISICLVYLLCTQLVGYVTLSLWYDLFGLVGIPTKLFSTNDIWLEARSNNRYYPILGCLELRNNYFS